MANDGLRRLQKVVWHMSKRFTRTLNREVEDRSLSRFRRMGRSMRHVRQEASSEGNRRHCFSPSVRQHGHEFRRSPLRRLLDSESHSLRSTNPSPSNPFFLSAGNILAEIRSWPCEDDLSCNGNASQADGSATERRNGLRLQQQSNLSFRPFRQKPLNVISG